MKKTAVIFDMDGVVSDTQKFHAEVESKLLAEYGVVLEPAAITARYAGVADEVMFAEIFAENGITVPTIEDVVFRKWDLMTEVAHGRITAIPHAVELIKQLAGEGFKLAIASASTIAFISEVLDELGIAAYFGAVVSAQEVTHGKPAPDVFLLAAERLGVEPASAVVIEDGRSGMIGAGAAGMASVGLVENTADDYPATVLVASLSEVNPAMLHRLTPPNSTR